MSGPSEERWLGYQRVDPPVETPIRLLRTSRPCQDGQTVERNAPSIAQEQARMSSRSLDRRESWATSRSRFEQRLPHSNLFAVPLKVIDWALARGLSDQFYAWLSHEYLVISSTTWQHPAKHRLVVIPKPDAIELRFSRAGSPTSHSVQVDDLILELDRWADELDRAPHL